MKHLIIFAILILGVITQLFGQERLKLYIKQDQNLIEINSQLVQIKKQPFEFVFEIHVDSIKSDFTYIVDYVSSMKKRTFKKYLRTGEFNRLSQYGPYKAMASNRNNSENFIYITENSPSEGYGILTASKVTPNTFNTVKFNENVIKCNLKVDNFFLNESIKIEDFDFYRVYFFVHYLNDNFIFQLEFLD